VAIPDSEFQKLVRVDKVAEVVVSQDQLQGELKEPRPDGKKRFVTVRVDAEMAKELDAHKVECAGRFRSDLLPMILSWVVSPRALENRHTRVTTDKLPEAAPARPLVGKLVDPMPPRRS